MKILALEFSSEQRSVAVLESRPGSSPVSKPAGVPLTKDGDNAQFPPPTKAETPGLLSQVSESGTRVTKALSLVAQALRDSTVEREQIECLAVGIGPGSYTGIRVAISLAQGWQLARSVKVLGISSVECLAAQAHLEGISGRVTIVIDAQRNEFYLATYQIDPGSVRGIEPLRLASLAEVESRIQAGEIVLGPEAGRWVPHGRVLFPNAARLAQLAADRTDFVAGEKLEPIYLRESNFVKAPPPRLIPVIEP
jgi:tRNA threonylcarbamoyl adenosine modification protein YeaZ